MPGRDSHSLSQPQPQPQPYQDPGVVPSSYQVPSTDPAAGRREPSPDQIQPPTAQDVTTGGTVSSEGNPMPESPAKRGLFGLLLKSRNPG